MNQNNKKNIIIVTPSYPPYVSGAATHFSQLVKHLGKKVGIIILTVKHPKTRNEKINNTEIVRKIPNYIHSNIIIRVIILPICTLLWLIYFSLRIKIKAIHVHSSNAMALGAAVFSFFTRKPLIYDVQDLMTPCWLLKLGNIKKYVATGTQVKNRIISCGISAEDIYTISSLPPDYISQVSTGRIENRLVTRLIYVGEINNKIKGVDLLIKAFNNVFHRLQNIELVIIGEGPDSDYCRQLVNKFHLEKVITIKGAVEHRRTLEEISRSDILILPSTSEGIPRVILEAFALGKPVIASNVGGIPEVVKNMENGFLVDPGNIDELSDSIITLVNDRELRNKMGIQAKEYIKKLPRWEEVANHLYSIYP